jgi:hypothetical protein
MVMGVILLTGLTACDDTSATTASCAFVAGNGQNGSDTKLHDIIYPGQSMNLGDNEEVSYFPCNSRNYIINDGTQKDANGNLIGDRHQPIRGTTSSGVAIDISATALWTVNQSKSAIHNFYNVCFKYNCASKEDVSGAAKFSTPGWNGMLGENFSPVMDQIGRVASAGVDDSIWQKQDPVEYKKLSDAMSAAWADAMRARLGYPEDLFCGSGNSGWSNPDKPGEGEFTCEPVRIVVDYVAQAPLKTEDTSEGAKVINAQRLESAKAVYEDQASFWLGLQDSIRHCRASGTTCVFNIGGNGALSVPLKQQQP